MKERFLKQAGREFSPAKRTVLLMIAAIFFLGIFPAALVYLSRFLDQQLGLPRLAFGAVNVLLGGFCVAAGYLLGWWSIYVQFTVGRGTPVPVMATQQLIIQRPYNYCRNPMALGAILAFLGIAILIGSISGILLVLLGAALLLAYIKFLEEKEMEARFGAAYREYREQTPFIIPRLRRRR